MLWNLVKAFLLSTLRVFKRKLKDLINFLFPCYKFKQLIIFPFHSARHIPRWLISRPRINWKCMSQSKKLEWRIFRKHIEQGRAKSKRWCKILQNNLGRESTLKVFRQVRLRFGFFVRAECALRFDNIFGLRCAHQVVVVANTGCI